MGHGKYLLVAERLSRRILNGDYHVQGFPAERRLAVEFGVSHMTARKALRKLVAEGLLGRGPNGRLRVCHGGGVGDAPTTQAQIALLVPAWDCNETSVWSIGLAQLSKPSACGVRVVYYGHWDDPVVLATVRRFDATFLLPIPEPAPAGLVSELRTSHRPLVVLGNDWSHLGIRSLRLYAPVFVQRLLDHLWALGHRRIDCLNVQPAASVIQEHMAQWKLWMAAQKLAGELIDEPVPSYTHTIAAAYEAVDRRIRERRFSSSAVLCTTEPAAAGAMRAMLDHGLRPGRDVAVCTVDSEMRGRYHNPTLTSLESPDPRPYLSICLEWMLAGEERLWQGPLLIQPADLPVFVGESTAGTGKDGGPRGARP